MAPECVVDECEKAVQARGMCPMHYQRWRIRGDVGSPKPERGVNSGPCSVDGCDDPMRKTGLCASHYAQKRRTGEAVPFAYKWADRDSACATCGRQAGVSRGLRKYCSQACLVGARLHPSGRPRSSECAQCGEHIDLMAASGKSGRLKRSTTRLCDACRSKGAGRHGRVVWDLAERDGTDCSICSEPVDMTLKRPESLFGPSVDHIIPRSRGGADDMANYALAHYWCNAVKSDRMNFTI